MLLYTVVDCGSPPSITNGSPGTPTSTTLGGTVTYSCSDGLIISGSAMITCLATGSWSTPPSCIGKVQSTIVHNIHWQVCYNISIVIVLLVKGLVCVLLTVDYDSKRFSLRHFSCSNLLFPSYIQFPKSISLCLALTTSPVTLRLLSAL